MSDPIKSFLNSIKFQPIDSIEYDGGMLSFCTWPEQIEYKVVAMPFQLIEFCEVEDPNQMRELDRWMNQDGFVVPSIVRGFITHSRAEWRQVIENPN